jgi:hypothetical protein
MSTRGCAAEISAVLVYVQHDGTAELSAFFLGGVLV